AAAPTRNGDLLRTGDAAALDAEPPDPHSPPSGCRFHPRCPIGPVAHPDRAVCRTVIPVLPTGVRGASCHFAGLGSDPSARPVHGAQEGAGLSAGRTTSAVPARTQ
ncbi:MAG: hypothetical protein B7X32_20765, partial [Microbacterium sp. 13-71-7]